VGASLLSIAVHTALSGETLPNVRFDQPAEVLAALNLAFPMEKHNHKFFTLWYAVYDRTSRVLRYAGAGHPPALLFDDNGSPPIKLGGPGQMIGVDADAQYDTHCRTLPPGSRLYVFSDGVVDVSRGDGQADGKVLGVNGLIPLLAQATAAEGSRVEQVLREIQALQGSPVFADDFSLLEIEFE
jgi:sigma-B regulation protein RsbU (phosphoserine phosphatase)